jgi:Ca2+-binding RTX toxin-like protein
MATFTGIAGQDGKADSLGSLTITGFVGDPVANQALLQDAIGDTFNLANGTNTVTGGLGSDVINGGTGIDTFIKRGTAADIMHGSSGADVFSYALTENGFYTTAVGDVIDGGADIDTIFATLTDFSAASITSIEQVNLDGLFIDPIDPTNPNAPQYGAATFSAAQVGNGHLSANLVVNGPSAQGPYGAHGFLYGSGGFLTFNMGTATTLNIAGFTFNNWGQSIDLYSRGVFINGDNDAETITGSVVDDYIHSGGGNDTLIGGAGNDLLDGGAGADALYGGFVSGAAGFDIATYYFSTAGVTVNLTTGTGSGGDAQGDTLFNIAYLSGSSYADNLSGNADNNGLDGGGGNDILNGGLGADGLSGGYGNDILNGGLGADTMYGAEGNDYYYVDNIGDVVGEYNTDPVTGGIDRVYSYINYTLTANVEILFLTVNSANTNGTGNDLNNQIYGNAGNNILDGGLGADVLAGGLGNDTYVLGADLSDTISDTGGIDTVTSTVTRSLTSFATIDNLTLLGAAAINGSGNNGNNVIIGNAASNTLAGGLGNDRLTGGLGADYFRFNTPTGATNLDTITDFSVVDDTIQLAASIFTALGPVGALAANQFHIGTSATTSTQHIIYDSATGGLYYDGNGNGVGVGLQVQIASLSTGLGLTNLDFRVI